MKPIIVGLILVGSCLSAAPPSPLLDTLSSELDRNFRVLKEKADPPAYFISYEVTDTDSHSIGATLGNISSHNDSHNRNLDIGMRVGTPKLDNYHLLGGAAPQYAADVAEVGLHALETGRALVVTHPLDRLWIFAARKQAGKKVVPI